MKKFSAQVDDWIAQSKARTSAVIRESVQRTVTDMQTPIAKGGNMPVDTGYLRNSLMGSTSQMPSFRDDASQDAGAIALEIAKIDPGMTFYAGYTANYAGHVHYGSRGRPARLWVDLAAQKWQKTVAAVAADLQRRIG